MSISKQVCLTDYVRQLQVEAEQLEKQIPTMARMMPGVSDAVEFQRKVLNALALIAAKVEGGQP